MCYVCDGARDLRTIFRAMAIMGDVDFDRAKTVVAGAVNRLDVLEEELNERGVDEMVVDLDDYFALEEPIEQSLKTTMEMIALTEAYIDEVRLLLSDATIVFPHQENPDHQPVDAFERFVEEMFDAESNHEEDDDDEV